jgi:sphingomyelin phosphodiesterase acid-like 3
MDDPFDQFSWLEKTLQQAKQNHTFAYIVGHVPPIIGSSDGKPQWHLKYSERYRAILKVYASLIKAQVLVSLHDCVFTRHLVVWPRSQD